MRASPRIFVPLVGSMASAGPTILIPVRGLNDGKQRLAGIVAPDERRCLVEAMLIDVITAARSCDQISRVVVVTDDQDAENLAARYGALVLRGGGSSGYSQCVRLAVDHLRRSDCCPIIVAPADVPLVEPEEFSAVAAAISLPGRIALVEAESDGGTNCIGFSPPALVDFQFGPSSFEAHMEGISRSGFSALKLDLPGLGFDVDRPEHLIALAGKSETTNASRLARSFDVAARATTDTARKS